MFYSKSVSVASTLNSMNLNSHIDGIFSSFPPLQSGKPILTFGQFLVGLFGLGVLFLQSWKRSFEESSKWAGDGS